MFFTQFIDFWEICSRKICHCGVPCKGVYVFIHLNSLSEGSFWPRYPNKDGDHSGNVPCYVPGILCQNSSKIAERFRITPGHARMREILS